MNSSKESLYSVEAVVGSCLSRVAFLQRLFELVCRLPVFLCSNTESDKLSQKVQVGLLSFQTLAGDEHLFVCNCNQLKERVDTTMMLTQTCQIQLPPQPNMSHAHSHLSNFSCHSPTGQVSAFQSSAEVFFLGFFWRDKLFTCIPMYTIRQKYTRYHYGN